jgi:hypothetical protein
MPNDKSSILKDILNVVEFNMHGTNNADNSVDDIWSN